MRIKTDQSSIPSHYEAPPKCPWAIIMLSHMSLAGVLSYLLYDVTKAGGVAKDFVDSVIAFAGTIVPNILGLAERSSNPDLGGIYLFLIWIGVPVYFMMFWQIASRGYYLMLKSEKSSKFWFRVIGSFLISLIPVFFPRVNGLPSAVKTVAAFEQLMNDFYLAFMFVGWSMMMATSMFMTVAIRWAILRITDGQ